ncbi:MAG: hypothetical protein H6723_08760 [Sandaracinus sp.]|nr:hypothetical protein [Sandaracinus sp.]
MRTPRIVATDAHREPHAIGDLEPDARDLFGDQVRIFAQHARDAFAVALENLSRERRAEPEAVQEREAIRFVASSAPPRRSRAHAVGRCLRPPADDSLPA